GVFIEGADIYWLEMRPREGGRSVLVGRTAEGGITDITPAPFNARTRVHEYGGGSVLLANATVWFSNFADQFLYRQRLRESDRAPQPLSSTRGFRYADGVLDRVRNAIICVREDHTAGEADVVNSIVAVDATGNRAERVLVSGNDFYSSPRLSPDGTRVAWLTWNHPNMPWDGTELWTAELTADGAPTVLSHVAGGVDESICQPQWSPDRQLYFISDRSGWWNIYCHDGRESRPVCARRSSDDRSGCLGGRLTRSSRPTGSFALTRSRELTALHG